MKTARLILLLFACIPASVHAAISGGSVTIIAPPANTGDDNQQVNELLGFNELQHVLLTTDLVVDVPATTIPAGTVVSSHYIIYDPPGSSSSITGTAKFDGTVIGVINSTTKLNNSDHLGLAVTNYLNPSLRGYESGDTATIDDPNTVSFDLSAGSPGDYARIITSQDYSNRGPQFVMRSPQVTVDGVHTNPAGIQSVRLLFDEPLTFNTNTATVQNENGQNVGANATGSGSPLVLVTFNDVLYGDKFTVTLKDSIVSSSFGLPIDGDNDGTAGGDYVFVMEHRERHDSNQDNMIDLLDLRDLAVKWLLSL